MAETVRETVRELLESTLTTVEQLMQLQDGDLASGSSHVCAQGGTLWNLITNDIDHETIHAGQILEARSEGHTTATQMERLVTEWLRARATFISTLVGMNDEEFNRETAEGAWTYRQVADHVRGVERHSMASVEADRRME
ncbi:MAG: hypothetical protein WEB00_06430 [Dehalococcoidia bacterium]